MKTLLLTIIFLMAFSPVDSPKNVTDYLQSIELDVEFISALYGIPKEIIYSQSCQETGFGSSEICNEKCNYFGVKEGEEYKTYDSKIESFIHYAKILNSSKCYQNLQPESVEEWLESLDCCHYATDSNYTKSLRLIITKYL